MNNVLNINGNPIVATDNPEDFINDCYSPYTYEGFITNNVDIVMADLDLYLDFSELTGDYPEFGWVNYQDLGGLYVTDATHGYVDTMASTQIPEPTSLALVVGILAVGLVSYFRRLVI